MSVIVKCPDGKIRVYIKGADSVIRKMITLNQDLIETTDHFMLNFARTGLRTLMIAYKEISLDEFEKWEKEYNVFCE